MDSINLRTLTLKSKIGFGTYKEETVQKLIDMGKQKELVNIYFKMSKISFISEVLDLIGITDEFRFEKPNTNLDLLKKFKKNKPDFYRYENSGADKLRPSKGRFGKSLLKHINQGYKKK